MRHEITQREAQSIHRARQPRCTCGKSGGPYDSHSSLCQLYTREQRELDEAQAAAELRYNVQ